MTVATIPVTGIPVAHLRRVATTTGANTATEAPHQMTGTVATTTNVTVTGAEGTMTIGTIGGGTIAIAIAIGIATAIGSGRGDARVLRMAHLKE